MQKITDFIIDSNRLSTALELLGYSDKQAKHIRHTLVLNILQFSEVNSDTELEKQATILLDKIKSE
ncbi:MAG: hypothetical protein HRU38_10795 [Saccharospirillaceae bacterium]|nr:hypothetical protein [Saccharospirillaceae bacterium]